MKIYVAASFEQKDQVLEVYKQLRAAGHEITADWTTHTEIASLSTSQDRENLRKEYAIEDVNGVKSADAYILLAGERKSTGAHIELGIALGAELKHIFIVGANPYEQQLFYSHPSIKHFENIESAISAL